MVDIDGNKRQTIFPTDLLQFGFWPELKFPVAFGVIQGKKLKFRVAYRMISPVLFSTNTPYFVFILFQPPTYPIFAQKF